MTREELLELPRYQIIRSILDETIDFEEVMRLFNIRVTFHEFSSALWGVVYCSRLGNYHIILNRYLDPATRQQVFFHELKHIIEDLPTTTYFIGLDRQEYRINLEADAFLAEVSAAWGG